MHTCTRLLLEIPRKTWLSAWITSPSLSMSSASSGLAAVRVVSNRSNRKYKVSLIPPPPCATCLRSSQKVTLQSVHLRCLLPLVNARDPLIGVPVRSSIATRASFTSLVDISFSVRLRVFGVRLGDHLTTVSTFSKPQVVREGVSYCMVVRNL